MSGLTATILTTVNAPYGAGLSAQGLADCISDVSKADKARGPVYSFFSEISAKAQAAFISEMGISKDAVQAVAGHFARLSGQPITLAA